MYLSFGPLITSSKILTLAIHVLFVSLSLYYILLCIIRCKKTKYIKSFFAVFILLMVYGGFFAIFGTDSSWVVTESASNYFHRYFCSMAPVIVFYYFGQNDMINEKWFRYVFILFIVAACYDYQYETRHIASLVINDGEQANNAGYYWLALMPLIAFYKQRPIIVYVSMALFSIMTIICMKRGPILIIAILDAILFIKLAIKNKSFKKSIWILVLSVIACNIIASFVGNMMETNSYFMSRITDTLEGKMSNREDMYPQYWHFFTSGNLVEIICGRGAYATVHYLGSFAHNDWLEFLINMGLVGGIIYLVYFYRFNMMRKHSKSICSEEVALAITLLLIINFAKTLFSMSIDNMQLYMSSVLGFCASQVIMVDNDYKQSINCINEEA